MKLPEVHFGDADRPLPNWREHPEEGADDDEELAQTPVDVVAMLGFDPLDE